MSLKEMLKGNVVAVGKNYKNLSNSELKLLLTLKCISNKNNYIAGTRKSILLKLFNLDKRSFDKCFDGLVKKEFIKIEGEISSYCHIKISKDETFETFDVEYILDMLNDLSSAEIKLFCIMISHVNFKKNKNYIYPSDLALAKNYYAEDLSDLEIEKKVESKGIGKIRNSLLEKGYILKIAAYRTSNNKKSTLGYFIKTRKEEVVDYDLFVKDEIEKTGMTLATKSSLQKQNYKNLEKYIYSDYEYKAEKETVNEVEIESESKTIDVAYKVKLEKLLNENYPGFINYKKLKEYVEKYGYEKMFDFFLDNYTEHQIYSINANDDFHRANIFYKNKIDNLFDKFLEEERAREFSRKIISPDLEYIEDICIHKKRNSRKGLLQILEENSVKQPEK